MGLRVQGAQKRLRLGSVCAEVKLMVPQDAVVHLHGVPYARSSPTGTTAQVFDSSHYNSKHFQGAHGAYSHYMATQGYIYITHQIPPGIGSLGVWGSCTRCHRGA